MKQESKIKVVLAVASLMLVLCVFNNDVFAGGEAASTGTVTSSIRFPWPLPEGEPPVIRPDVSFFNSSKWPQALQDFLRVELLYGDRKIDALEAKYLVNAAFQSQNKTDANGIVSDIQPIAVFMIVFSAEANAIEACVSAIQSKTNYSKEKCKRLLEEEIEKNRSSIDAVKSLCQEIVAEGGNVTMNKESVSDWCFYQLLKTPGITPAIYSKLVTDNQFYQLAKTQEVTADIYRKFVDDNRVNIIFALEALKFIDEPNDYVFSMTDFVLKETALVRLAEGKQRLSGLTLTEQEAFQKDITEQKLRLVGLSEHINAASGEKLLEIIHISRQGTLDKKGRWVGYVSSIGLEDELTFPLGNTYYLIELKSDYFNARKEDKLLDFFATRTYSYKTKPDKSWLLYRYHPELIKQLTEIYNSDNLPADYSKEELKEVLSGVVKLGEIFKEYTPYLPDKKILN